MRRICGTLLVLSVLLAGSPALAGEAPFAPDSERAGWLWPASFSLYAARTAVWDFPAAYLIDTPRVGAAILKRKDADTAAELVRSLQDPYLTVKDPIAAELRRRTGKDFGYADSASRLKRSRAVAKWAVWARKQGGR